MLVTVSDISKVYHLPGCRYAKRITAGHKMEIGKKSARKHGYRPCKCCGHLVLKCLEKDTAVKAFERKKDVKVKYYENAKALFIRTFFGFWKVCWERDMGFILYHLNQQEYDPDRPMGFLKNRGFHRQKDVKPTNSLAKILNYVVNHDRAKAIIATDYRKLPRCTKRQKVYYNRTDKKIRRQRVRRVEELFRKIEKDWEDRGLEEYTDLAIC